jgi:acetyl-CoA acetyltransferase
MMKRSKAEELGLPILAKHVATSVAGLAPRIMGIVSPEISHLIGSQYPFS